jgi:hypothetical protein
MGRACSTNGGSRGVYRVLVGKPEGRNHLKDRIVDGRIILKWILENWNGGGMDSIDLVQNRDRWRAVVNAVMNLRAAKIAGNFLITEDLLAFQEGLCSMELAT